MKEINALNKSVYTDMPIDELETRMAMEQLEERLEMVCWTRCEGAYCAPNQQWCQVYCSFGYCSPWLG